MKEYEWVLLAEERLALWRSPRSGSYLQSRRMPMERRAAAGGVSAVLWAFAVVRVFADFLLESECRTMELLWFLLIGLAAGWLAGQLTKGGGYGVVGDLIVGVIGALLGGFLFGLLGISAGGRMGSLIT